mgnify:CR=1 FL=1
MTLQTLYNERLDVKVPINSISIRNRKMSNKRRTKKKKRDEKIERKKERKNRRGVKRMEVKG